MKIIYLSVITWAFAQTMLTAHQHYEAGVADLNQNNQPDAGEPLKLYGPDPSGKIHHLLARPFGFRPAQRCGGHYMLGEGVRTLFPDDVFSFTALSDGQEISPPEPGHAHTGAWIWLEITAVSGPPGGNFGYWEKGRSAIEDTPTISFAANEPAGDFAFVLSGGGDSPDEDPQGHFHGREWTADKPGDYHVSFRLVDRSTSGPGGGPWHVPGEIFSLHFRAGPDFQPSVTRNPANQPVLTWQSQMGTWDDAGQPGVLFRVLRSTGLAGGWEEIGAVEGTTAATATFTDPAPPAGKAFYRLAYDWAGQPETEP